MPGTRGPRERIVYSAAQLVRAKGVSGTGLREVVERADAPWGSLQHYFPGGKEQIVGEALAWAGNFAAGRVEQYSREMRTPTPGGLFARMARQWEDEFARRGFVAGCPLVAAAADVAADSAALRGAIAAAFDTWRVPLQAALRRMGVPRARSASLAIVMLSALEGAIVLARTSQDLGPLRTVVRELRPLLDGAVVQDHR
jgi:AcrR family transcriptional regulator